MSAVFADTFYWIALINPGDRYAQEVQRFDDLLSGGNVYTTEEVLVEVLTFFAADTWLRIRAVETVDAPGLAVREKLKAGCGLLVRRTSAR